MYLSVAYTFEPGLLDRLAAFPEVREVYGKLDRDVVGGGRATFTLRPVGRREMKRTVAAARRRGIVFNYLLNGATLGGLEQTRRGQRRIRSLLDWLAEAGVEAVTVSSPFLLRLVKRRYPGIKVRVGVFARIGTPAMARQWEGMGADTLCVSAIAVNRDVDALRAIRASVRCDLQLIANASCFLDCAHELTHMNLLTEASRRGGRLGGFCFDHCFLHCSARRLREPVNYIRATWIRPEDLHVYEALGYTQFKIVERSCPGDLLVRRVQAYARRSFDGNLLELVGPVAQFKKEQGATVRQRWRFVASLFRPRYMNVGSLLAVKRYAHTVIPHRYDAAGAPVYIDNRSLDGFLEGLMSRDCRASACRACDYCEDWARRVVRIDPAYREKALAQAAPLEEGMLDGSLWE